MVAEDPLKVMTRAYSMTMAGSAVCFSMLCYFFLNIPGKPSTWRWFSLCGLLGMACAYLFVIITQYYTDYKYSQVSFFKLC